MTTKPETQVERAELIRELENIARHSTPRQAEQLRKAAALLADGKAGGEPFAWYSTEHGEVVDIEWNRQKPKYPGNWKPLYEGPQPAAQVAQPLTVWFDQMPESNGKRNWTVMLRRKGSERVLGSIAYGVCFERTEYYDRARYAADRLRFLIGELDKEPDILNYNPDILQPGEAAHGIGKDQA